MTDIKAALDENDQEMEDLDGKLEETETDDQFTKVEPTETEAEEDAQLSVSERQTTDTTPEFLSIFGGKKHFDSWEEFSTLFEEFQEATGSVFKPKSAVTAEYANERRIRAPIPERFVYSRVRMICEHFGEPRKTATTKTPPPTRTYKGKGCEASVHLGYSRGSMHIVKFYLVHTNHTLHRAGTTPIKTIRAFSFNDELDLIMSRAVLENNPFECRNQEPKWKEAVENLKQQDKRLKSVAVRMLKKRIRFLMERYSAINKNREPLPDDEMGNILQALNNSKLSGPKDQANDGEREKGKRGRKKKKFDDSFTAEDSNFYDDEPSGGISNDDSEDDPSVSPPKRGRSPARAASARAAALTRSATRGRRKMTPKGTPTFTKTTANSNSNQANEISSLLQFLQRKEEEDRKLRQDEMKLRKEELALHKRELELQQTRFESHLNLLKAQYEEMGRQSEVVAAKKTEGNVEYTIQVINPDLSEVHEQPQ